MSREDRIKGLEGLVLKREIRDDFLDTIATNHSQSIVKSIEEFIANAYDADAENVRITYDHGADTLTIEDDGDGMLEELKEFYGLGGSKKLAEKLTTKGRRKIGKFGMATILLKALAGEYTLETMKEGIKATVSEKVGEEKLTPVAKIPKPKYELIESDKHGTKIVMRNLKFGKDTPFKLKDLVKSARRGFPLWQDDFSIEVNEEKLTHQQTDTARKYRFCFDTTNNGKVTGTFFYANRPIKDEDDKDESGVYLYVNGRQVGDAKDLIQTASRGIAQRVLAEVFADGLEEAIILDRGRFVRDHKGIVELKEKIAEMYAEIRREVEAEEVHKEKKGKLDAAEKVFEEMEKRVSTADFRRLFGTQSVFIKRLSANELTELRIDTETAVSVYKDQGIIYVNKDHEQFRVTNDFDRSRYSANLHYKIAVAIAREVAGNESGNDFATKLEDIYERLKDKPKGKLVTQAKPLEVATTVSRVSPNRIYSPSELRDATGRSILAIRRLTECGFMLADGETPENCEILGSDASTAFALIEGWTSLQDLVTEIEPIPENRTSRYKTITGQFSEKGDDVSYLWNLGIDDVPCFFIRDGMLGKVRGLLTDAVTRDALSRSSEANPLKDLDELRVTFLDAINFTKPSGATGRDIAAVIKYAKEKGLNLDQVDIAGAPRFRYSALLTAMDQMKKEPK